MTRESVGADGDRRPLSLQEWIGEHFNTAVTPGPLGHGFTEVNRKDGTAYYTVDSGPVALIVLDTANPGGFAAGSLDADQFAWLEEQLKARSRSYIDRNGRAVTSSNHDQLIVVASHHTCAAMNNPFPGLKPQSERFRGPQVEEFLYDRHGNIVGSDQPNVKVEGNSAPNSNTWDCGTPEGFRRAPFSSTVELY